MTKEFMNVCFAPDNNYIVPCCIAISSLLSNTNEDDYINIIILDGTLTEESKTIIKDVVNQYPKNKLDFITVDDSLFKQYDTEIWGTATAYRLKAASLLPDIDKILYLDCDICVLKSIKPLYDTELKNNAIALVPDIWHKTQRSRFKNKKQTYFNAGIMLINLKKWRDENYEEKLEQYFTLNKNFIKYPDQDTLNMVFDTLTYELPFKYNFVWMNPFDKNECKTIKAYQEAYEDPVIVHFIFNKPFFSNSNYHEFADRYFDQIVNIPPQYSKMFKKFYIKKLKNKLTLKLFNLIPVITYKDFGKQKYLYLFNIIPICCIR